MARIPVPIRTKLAAVLGLLVALLLIVGLVGITLLRDANARAGHLTELQRKTAAYRDLRQSTSDQLSAVASALTSPSAGQLDTAARQLNLARFDVERLEFVAADERELVELVGQAHTEFIGGLQAVLDLAQAGRSDEARGRYATTARPLADRLDRRTNQLVHKAAAETLDAVEASRVASERSQAAIIGFAIGSVLVALVLGAALSLSIISPVRAMDRRLAEIAAGDFARHVSVVNRDELGTLAAHLNAMNDELGRLYGEVEAANRNKTDFLANMSHELRTPLNAIIGFSDVLEQRMFGQLNDQQSEYVRDISESGRHLLNLVNEILDLAKVEAGRMELEPTEFVLDETIRGAIAFVRERAAQHDIELATDVAPDVGTLLADERKVRQVLLNLLSNAVKFTPDGGRVGVSARRIDDEVEVSVRDTGIGIALEDLPRVFEEFQQVGGPSERAHEGTGLGLTLAKRFIELHGGRIWVDSEVGKGTTFTFAIPTNTRPGTSA